MPISTTSTIIIIITINTSNSRHSIIVVMRGEEGVIVAVIHPMAMEGDYQEAVVHTWHLGLCLKM